MVVGVIRNRTKTYVTLREGVKRKRPSISTSGQDSGIRLTSSDSATVGIDSVAVTVHDKSLIDQLPPEWVDVVEGIHANMAEIKQKMSKLNQLHSERLKVSFDQEKIRAQERSIEILTEDTTQEFRLAESGLKRIATIGNDTAAQLPVKERVVRLNVMRSLAAELQSQSKLFRKQQKDFVLAVRGQQEAGGEFFDEDDRKGVLGPERSEDMFSAEDIQELEQIEKKMTDRDQEIMHIAKSVGKLAEMFREMNMLVIEQGTIVDRIDYNVEQTVVHMKKANVELKIADEYSKKAGRRTLCCIGLLLMLIVVFGAILIDQKNQEDKKQ